MNIIRWILFLPAAIISSIIISAIFYFMGNLLAVSSKYTSGVTWFFAGVMSAYGWMMIGAAVAPQKNGFTKWSLLSLLILISIASGVGGVFGIINDSQPANEVQSVLNPNWGRFLLSVGMFIASLFYISRDPEDIDSTKI